MSVAFRPKVDRWLAMLLVGSCLLPWVLAGWLSYRGEHAIALILVVVGSMELGLMRLAALAYTL